MITIGSRRKNRRTRNSQIRRKVEHSIESLEQRWVMAGYVPLAPTASPLWLSGYFTQSGTVDLEAAAALAPDVAAGEAASLPRDVKVNSAGLPLLESRASGTGLELFLDFPRNADGYGPFSLDADRNTFNFAEQMAIFTCWRGVAAFFSQFNVNVTTVLPPTGGADPVFAWVQVTNDFAGGAAYVDSLTKSGPTGHVNSSNATDRISGIVHEYGHILGLPHQANVDKYTNISAEYSNGDGYRNVPIMGVDYNGQPNSRWWYGRGSWGDGGQSIFDDVQLIASKIASVGGGDGFRTDDYGNTLAGALTLADGAQQLDGYIERYNDADLFKITPAAAGNWNFTVTPLHGSQAQPKLELLDASGNVIAARDDATLRNGPTNEQFLNVSLAADTYYVRVASSGDYAELGYYKLGASALPSFFVSDDVGVPELSGSVSYASASGVFTQSGGGTDIWNTSDQFRYTYETLTGNGSITARVDGLDNIGTFTKAGVMIRQSLAANSQHAYIGILPSGNIDTIRRLTSGGGSANVNNNGQGPWVRLTRAGNVITFARSADGTNWVNLGTATITMTGPVLIGLATSAWSGRYEAFATFSNVTVTGNVTPAAPVYNALPAPATLTAAPASGANTSIDLSWSSVVGATGYRVERSINGVNFSTLVSVGAATTSYTDVNPWGSMRWFYRVAAADGSSNFSPPSPIASEVNKPNAPGLPGYTAPVIGRGTNELDLNWLDVQGETGYRLERSTDGVNFTLVANRAANQTSYNITGLATGTAYTLRVTPLTTVGDDVAPPLLINTQTRMAAVTNLRFTAKSSTSMTIAWNDSPLESGYRVERSTDGVNWTFMGDTAANVTTYTSNNLTPLAEYYFRVMPWNATFDGIMSSPIFAAAPAAVELPAPWLSQDIGAVAGSGAAGFSGGAFTLVSNGADIWGTADQFRYIYQPLNGDGQIVARVAQLEGTGAWAKLGVMIRETLNAGSKQAMVVVTPDNGVAMQYRNGTNGVSTHIAGVNVDAPYWVKLVRAGNVLTGFSSPDGNTWTQVGSVTITMAASVFIGLSGDSFTTTNLNTSVFDNVSVAGSVSSVPGTPDLVAASDSGASSTDNLTNRNNSAAGQTLQFLVANTISGATVTLYFGAVVIGTAVATGATTTVSTNGTVTLADGDRSITARQSEPGKTESAASAALVVSIDTAAPSPPAAPDLQSASDTGASNSDNVTGDATPTFDLVASPYFRFFRDGAQISGDYEAGPSYTTTPQTTGTFAFAARVVDAAGNVSALGAALSVTIERALSVADVSIAEGNSGSTIAAFVITLSSAAAQQVSVAYATANGTAEEGADYTAASGAVTFAPGETSRTVNVTILGDVLDEADETFTFQLSAPIGAILDDAQATGTILDNDAAPSMSLGDLILAEGTGGANMAAVDVALSQPSGRVVTVVYSTAAGSAAAGSDFAAVSGTVTFAPGAIVQSVLVPIVTDSDVELDESFTLNLSNPSNATLADNQASITITNDDAVGVSIADVTVTEADAGLRSAVFAVTLSGSHYLAVTVAYSTANGTALGTGSGGTDYSSRIGNLTFNPGETSLNIIVPTLGDTLDEADETFFVNLSNPTNATLADSQATGTIVDNDPSPSASMDDLSIVEGDAGTQNAAFAVSLSAASGQSITIEYVVQSDTATAPDDFTAVSGAITFSAGATVRTINVPIVGDGLDEADETFTVTLFNPTNVTLADGLAVGTITDDDAAPSLSIADLAVPEGDVGAADATFAVSLSAPSGKPITVVYATSGGSATAPEDFTQSTGTLTFEPGTTSQPINVPIIGDADDEIDETFTLTLSSPENATLADNSAIGTIIDDDEPVGSLAVINTNDSGPGSLRAAIDAANSTPGAVDTITFAIAGPAPHAIALASPLPALADAATFEISGDVVEIGTFSPFELDGFPGLTKTGDGTLVLGGVGSMGGASLTVAEGTVQLAAGSNLVLVVDQLSIAAGAVLDAADNDIIIRAAAATRESVLAAVTGWVATGFNAFGWDGTGIASSAAAADDSQLSALGVMLNDDGQGGAFHATFAGQGVDQNSVLVKYTYYGDADLSGVVDGTDYALVDNGFNAGLTGWFSGDFDYSQAVDGTDYALIDNAFNSQTGPLGSGPPAVFSPIPRAADPPRASTHEDSAADRAIAAFTLEPLEPFAGSAPTDDLLDVLVAGTPRRRRG